MSKVVLNNLADLNNSNTVIVNYNANNGIITTAFDDTISRAGFTPNQMNSPLDMNNNRIINLPAPGSLQDPVRLIELNNAIAPVIAGNVLQTRVFDSRAAAILISIPIGTGISYIVTGGYSSAGDGGQATYFRTGGTTAGGFQTADGSWWALSGPDVNICQFGAVQGQANAAVTTTAFNDAVTLQTARGGGRIYVPQGGWFVNSTITFPTTTTSIELIGSGVQETAVQINNVNASVFKVISANSIIRNLTILGYNNVAVSAPTIWMSNGTFGGAVGSKIEHCSILYGLYGVFIDTGDVILEDIFVTQAYGALVYIENPTSQAQAWLRRCKLDQGWPNVNIPAYGTLGSTVPGWAAGQAYPTGTVRSVFQGGKTYILQAIVGGTSATTPVVVGYNTIITDNNITWQLALPSTLAALWCDSNSSEVHCEQCDFNGSYSNAVQLTNTQASGAPAAIFIEESVFGGGVLNSMINAAAGGFLVIRGCEISGTILNPSNSIVFGGSWVGPAIISDNVFYGLNNFFAPTESTNAIQIAVGTNTLIKNNYIGQMGTCGVSVSNGITRFGINGNTFNGTPTAIIIGSGCDRFTIQDNMTDGGVTNGSGTSTSKIVANNV